MWLCDYLQLCAINIDVAALARRRKQSRKSLCIDGSELLQDMLQSLWHGLLTSKACQPVVDIAKIKETETVSLVDFIDSTLFIEYAICRRWC